MVTPARSMIVKKEHFHCCCLYAKSECPDYHCHCREARTQLLSHKIHASGPSKERVLSTPQPKNGRLEAPETPPEVILDPPAAAPEHQAVASCILFLQGRHIPSQLAVMPGLHPPQSLSFTASFTARCSGWCDFVFLLLSALLAERRCRRHRLWASHQLTKQWQPTDSRTGSAACSMKCARLDRVQTSERERKFVRLRPSPLFMT